METYVILRRAGWRTVDDLAAAAERSTTEGERMPDDVALDPQLRARGARRLRRHRLRLSGVEPGGDPPPREAADLPVDEIVKVADTVIVRPDPAPVAA